MSDFIQMKGTGALFANVNDDGEIIITGTWVSPEGLTFKLHATPIKDGSLSVSGEVINVPEVSISGILSDPRYNNEETIYKAGTLCIQSKDVERVYKVNSKLKNDTNGQPFRPIWLASCSVGTKRVAC